MKTARPLVVMFVGVPGSGKTTFARQLARELDAVVLASDSIRIAMWGSREVIDTNHATKEQRTQANKLTFGALNYATEQIVGAGHSVIYDCNANHYDERNEKYQIAAKYDALPVVVRIRVPYEVSLERIQQREDTHDARRFTKEKARQVLRQFQAEIQEPGAHENVVVINGQEAFPVQLASFKKALASF